MPSFYIPHLRLIYPLFAENCAAVYFLRKKFCRSLLFCGKSSAALYFFAEKVLPLSTFLRKIVPLSTFLWKIVPLIYILQQGSHCILFMVFLVPHGGILSPIYPFLIQPING
jgi:hypothetical protein